MKITDMETIRISIPLRKHKAISTRPISSRQITGVRIFTDEGITGAAFTSSHAPAAIIEGTLKKLLIGEDPFSRERIWNRMYGPQGTLTFGRRGAAVRAISAVDIALWDIIGKASNKPIYKLLGGYRDKVPVYASGGYYKESEGIEDLAKEMAAYVERGFTAVKMRVGLLDVRKDAQRVKAARDAIGPDVKLMLDANNAYNAYTAIKAAREFEKYDIYFLEEPVPPDDIRGSAQVAATLDMPIASGELEYTVYGFRDLIENKAVDIIQADASVAGGISEWMKVAALAGAYNIPLAPHSATEVHVHLAAAVPNCLFVEFFDKAADIRKVEELYGEQMEPENGYLEAPRKPGLGIELDEEAIKKYQVK
ncbi:mandelate racemase/muconate lactonizing enzyme family protein [Candidatus Bathyarchaeota archaeon]|nr:mandelate racemase/muconate lactonizing enzyme family protein [Candidatus Bathyarchaeota archaeon]